MKFYYKNIGYTCNWKTKMRKDMWYSMEPARIRVTLPKNIYLEILKYIKEDNTNKKLFDKVNFTILKSPGEELYFNKSIVENLEIWEIECFLNSSVVSSEYKKKGTVSVHFDVNIHESKLLEKDEARDIILNEIL